MEKSRVSNSTFEFNAKLSECKDLPGLSLPMSPADELFCNGRIRPMKPFAVTEETPSPNYEHRKKAQASVISKKGNDREDKYRGRQNENENESRHRCLARSLSPKRNFFSHSEGKGQRNSAEEEEGRIQVPGSASPSALPKSRGSRRSWSLRDIFLNRSKSEGREQERDERELSFSSYSKSLLTDKEKKKASAQAKPTQKKKMADTNSNKTVSSPNRKGVPVSAQELYYISSPNRQGVPASPQEVHYMSSPNRRGVPVSAHELHYIANRAQTEELKRKTFLPYRQGVLGCLGFPSSPSSIQAHVLESMY